MIQQGGYSSGKVGGNIFDEKVRGIHEKLSKSGENVNALANVLEMLTSTFNSIFCYKDNNYQYYFFYTAEIFESNWFLMIHILLSCGGGGYTRGHDMLAHDLSHL